MRWTTNRQLDRGERGLTLLEVLAAAMIFALVMTVLISTSSTAVHNVGVSARRLEANLVADELLADLEIQMKQGIAPVIEENETTRDQYAIRVFRTEIVQDQTSADSGGTQFSVASMLGAELPEVAKHLKQYDIEVSWFEQNGPQRVTRTTFAFDWQTAAIEYSDLFARNNGIAGGLDQLGDDETGDGQMGGTNGGSGSTGRNRPGSTVSAGDTPRERVRQNGRNARKEHFRRLREQEQN
jgi:Tfp pilus assembly protein PilV